MKHYRINPLHRHIFVCEENLNKESICDYLEYEYYNIYTFHIDQEQNIYDLILLPEIVKTNENYLMKYYCTIKLNRANGKGYTESREQTPIRYSGPAIVCGYNFDTKNYLPATSSFEFVENNINYVGG